MPSKPTEAALKRKPSAVVMLTTFADATPNVPAEGYDFEWFNTPEAAGAYYDEMVTFNRDDIQSQNKGDEGDLACLVVEITDTSTMTLGRLDVAPATAATNRWLDAVRKQPSSIVFPEEVKAAKKATAKKVSPPKKAVAKKATATKEAAPKKAVAKKAVAKKAAAEEPSNVTDIQTANLRKRLASKKATSTTS